VVWKACSTGFKFPFRTAPAAESVPRSALLREKALVMEPLAEHMDVQSANWDFAIDLPNRQLTLNPAT